MRDDLLDAKACIDWAVSKFEPLEERMEAWLDVNFELEIVDPDPNCPNNVIVARHHAPVPADFNVEVGALINTIRCSLDLLATSLAYRFSVSRPDKVYFPILDSADVFSSGKYKGAEFINGLPKIERTMFESLKPYKGGDALLWPLHQLDVMRKHRKLLRVCAAPQRFRITGPDGFLGKYFTVVQTVEVETPSYQETVIGLMAKDAPYHEMSMSGQIALNEATLGVPKPVIAALRDFASLADSVIKLFDYL